MYLDKLLELAKMPDDEEQIRASEPGDELEEDEELEEWLDDSEELEDESEDKYLTIQRGDGKTVRVKQQRDTPPEEDRTQTKKRGAQGQWRAPKSTDYRNPNIGAYPNLKPHTGDVKTMKGQIVSDSGVIQPVIPSGSKVILSDSRGDSGNYYSDLVDLINDSGVIESVFNKQRIRHASRYSDQSEPYIRKIRHIGESGAVILLILACCSTINLCDWKLQLFLYVSVVAVAIATDALKMTARYLARPSRAMIAGMMWLDWLAAINRNQEFWLVASGLSVMTAFIIYRCNLQWLDSENWLFTDAVRQTIVNDPEGNPVIVWEDHGKREARVLAHEIGIPTDWMLLEGLIRPFFCLGVAVVYKKLIKAQASITRLLKALAKNQKELVASKQTIETLTEALEDYKTIFANKDSEDKEAMEILLEKNQDLRDTNAALQSKIDLLIQANEELKEENQYDDSEESAESLEESEESTESATGIVDFREYKSLSDREKELRDENARELFRANFELGGRKVQDLAGVPYKTCLKLKKEVAQERERKIVPMKSETA